MLHVAAAIVGDPPIWDEAIYLDWGRHFLLDGAPLTLPEAPGYSLLLGALSLGFGSVGAIWIVGVGSALAFSGAIGALAFFAWRTPAARVLGIVLALGSTHALCRIGVHRTAMAVLLLGAVALGSERRKVWGHGAFFVCALAAYSLRPETSWAAPILPLAIWRLSPGARPTSKAVRIGYVGALAVLTVLGAALAARDGASRNWFAFMQHYALYRQPALSGVLGPSFSPWFDFEKVIAIDFPGASSPLGALRVAPGLVLGFLLANAKTAATLALGSIAASPDASAFVLALAAAVVFLAVAVRGRTHDVGKGVGWLALAMAATSATALEVVSNSRHVLGLSIALAFCLGLLASRRLAGRRFVQLIPVLIALGSLVIAFADAHKLFRYTRDIKYPVSAMIAAVRKNTGGRPAKVAGQCNLCICAYVASSCTELGPAQGYTAENQCALFDGEADVVSLRLDAGRDAAPPCDAPAYELLGRWPAIGMEVWGRRSPDREP